MYELIILSQLLTEPMHGYLIGKIINDIIGPYAKLSNGRLYPLLAKLQVEKLIEEEGEGEDGRHGERQSRRYRITEEGRKRWHQLMLDTTSNPGDYQRVFFMKVSFLKLLNHEERVYVIDHYINYCQAHVLHLMAEAQDLAIEPYAKEHLPSLEATLDSMQHLIDQWHLELAWVQKIRPRELAEVEGQTESAAV